MPGKKLKIAVFGSGYWATLQIPSWQAAGAEVTALWNRTYEKAANVAGQFGIPHVYRTPEEIFENEDFDIADIITGEGAHYELVMMAAKYKKAVICQKPMANTFEECLEMVKACDEAGVWFAMHENFRFKRSFARLREYLDSQALGKLYRADLIFRTPKGSRLRESPYLMAMDHMALRDMGCHIFDLTRFLFGEASSIYCGLTSTCPDPDVHVQDMMISLLKMKNGMLVKSEGCNDRKAQLFISGEKGTITMDAANRIFLNIEGREETLDPPVLVKPDYIPQRSWDYHGGEGMLAIRACLETLIAAYQKNEPAYSSGHEYLKTMELVFRAIASTDENRVAQLKLTK